MIFLYQVSISYANTFIDHDIRNIVNPSLPLQYKAKRLESIPHNDSNYCVISHNNSNNLIINLVAQKRVANIHFTNFV